MVRLRLARLGLVAALGLMSGCMNFSQHPLMSRFQGMCGHSGEICGLNGCCEMPCIDDAGPMIIPPSAGAPGTFMSPQLTPAPQSTIPSLTPAPQPRLVPQPQAQPFPAPPQ